MSAATSAVTSSVSAGFRSPAGVVRLIPVSWIGLALAHTRHLRVYPDPRARRPWSVCSRQVSRNR
jgi:hypothetical protein